MALSLESLDLPKMFSYLSNLVWGAQEETDVADASEDLEVEHSIHEEAGDWIVVTTGTDQPKEQSKSDVTSQESECDLESACSDGSWTITPAPTFRVTETPTYTDTDHPLENLLIEHPTMSVYGQVPVEGEVTRGAEEDERRSERNEREQERQAREVVMLRNRQRYQVAVQLQLPMQNNHNHCAEHSAKTAKTPLRVTRKGARRHNQIKQKNARGKQNLHVKKCSFVAGRRRC